MKKIIFTSIILLGCLSFNISNAQVSLGIGVNINAQPEWGPVGYTHADYYYLPDADAYYDVNAHQYVYAQDNIWIHGAYLPGRFRNYDVYHGYKVVVNEREPWRRDNDFRTRYAGYRGHPGQPIIRDSRDTRYQNHWHGDNGNHYGRDRGHWNDSRNHWHNRGRGNDHGHGGDHGDGHGHDHGRG